MKEIAIAGLVIAFAMMTVNAVFYAAGKASWVKNNKAIMAGEAVFGLLAVIYFMYSLYTEKWFV